MNGNRSRVLVTSFVGEKCKGIVFNKSILQVGNYFQLVIIKIRREYFKEKHRVTYLVVKLLILCIPIYPKTLT